MARHGRPPVATIEICSVNAGRSGAFVPSDQSGRTERSKGCPGAMILTNRWRWWARRAIVLLAGVYLLGKTDAPLLIPYLTALLAIVGDSIRTMRKGEAR